MKTKEPKMDAPMIVVKPGEGRSVSLGGMGVVFKVSATDTGGDFAVVGISDRTGTACAGR
jgi:hypothetical protein